MKFNGQDSRVNTPDAITPPVQHCRSKAIPSRRQLPKMRGIMAVSIAVAALCSIPMTSALTCEYQVLKDGKCVDPTCAAKQADEYKWAKDGTCVKCELYQTASKDHKTCVKPDCKAKADEFVWEKLGTCTKCPKMKTADADHKKCIDPTCMST